MPEIKGEMGDDGSSLLTLASPAVFTPAVFESEGTARVIWWVAVAYWVAGIGLAQGLSRWQWLRAAAAYGRHNPIGGAVPRAVGFSLLYVIGALFTVLWFAPVASGINSAAELVSENAEHRPLTVVAAWVSIRWYAMPVVAKVWLIHVLRRFFECVLVHRFSGTMTLFGFVAAATFYVAYPATTRILCRGGACDGTLTLTGVFSVGAACVCQLGQLAVHVALRRHGDTERATRHWAAPRRRTLPTGNGFQLVVAPHYTCEILMYTALAFACTRSTYLDSWLSSLPILFTLSNLCQAAQAAFDWLANGDDPAVVHRRGRRNVRPGQTFFTPRWLLFPGVM